MSEMGDMWIKESVKRPGRVRRYIKECYGEKAFDKMGDIKMKYLNMAIKKTKMEHKTSLEEALNEAKTLKKLNKKRMVIKV